MQYSTIISSLQNLTNKPRIKQSEIAKILGVSKQAITNRIRRGIEFSKNDVELLGKYYNVDLVNNNFEKQDKIIRNYLIGGDRIEINYWEELPEEMKNPKIASVWFDREIIENDWGLKPESLCIIPMVGDSLTKYWYPIRNSDILMVNKNIDHIRGNGVYFATSRENTRFWIREMQIDMDMNVEFRSYSPSGEEKKSYTLKQLEDVDFKLIGKVVKNMSFRL